MKIYHQLSMTKFKDREISPTIEQLTLCDKYNAKRLICCREEEHAAAKYFRIECWFPHIHVPFSLAICDARLDLYHATSLKRAKLEKNLLDSRARWQQRVQERTRLNCGGRVRKPEH